MAVETNKDANVSPAQSLTGVAAAVASSGSGPNGNGKAAANRRKRPSSLLAAANQLPRSRADGSKAGLVGSKASASAVQSHCW